MNLKKLEIQKIVTTVVRKKKVLKETRSEVPKYFGNTVFLSFSNSFSMFLNRFCSLIYSQTI